MTKTPGLEHCRKIEHCSNSGVCNFKRCPRRRFYQLCGLEKRGGIHHAAIYGNGFHAAAPWLLRGEMKRAIGAFKEEWGDRDNLEDKNRNTGEMMKLMETFMRGHEGHKALWERVEAPREKVEIEGCHEDEVPFAIDIDMEVPFVGKIDVIGRHRDNGGLYAVDYKTVGSMSSMFVEGFWFSPQLIGYVVALRSMSIGDEVNGGIVEAIETKISKKWGVRVQTIVEEVEDWMCEDWLTWVRDIGGRMLRAEEEGVWLKDPSGCQSYDLFANAWFVCDYWQLCAVVDWTDVMGLFDVKEPFDMFKKKSTIAKKEVRDE